MSVEELLDPEMNGHDFRMRMWKYETPSFPKYYDFNKNRRTNKKRKIKEISSKLKGRIK